MRNERKLYLILIIVLSIPAILFLLKPEINIQNKFIKFSWSDGLQTIQHAIEKKNPKELTDKVYGDFNTLFKNKVWNQKADLIYTNYLTYSKRKAKRFLDKCKTFIS